MKDDIGVFLKLWDELKDAAGISSTIIVHHAGSEQIRDVRAIRSRGDTRLMGWADSIVRIHKTASGARVFHAECRGGDDVPASLLLLDKETRRMTLGALDADVGDEEVIRLRELVAEQSGPATTRGALALLASTGVPDTTGREVIARAEKVGAIKRIDGPRKSKLITLTHDWSPR